MHLPALALLPAGLLLGTALGAAGSQALRFPLPGTLLLGIACAVAAAFAVRSAWQRAPHRAFFLPAAAALPIGLLL